MAKETECRITSGSSSFRAAILDRGARWNHVEFPNLSLGSKLGAPTSSAWSLDPKRCAGQKILTRLCRDWAKYRCSGLTHSYPAGCSITSTLKAVWRNLLSIRQQSDLRVVEKFKLADQPVTSSKHAIPTRDPPIAVVLHPQRICEFHRLNGRVQ